MICLHFYRYSTLVQFPYGPTLTALKSTAPAIAALAGTLDSASASNALQLPVINQQLAKDFDFLLLRLDGKLTLRDTRGKTDVDICIDFSSPDTRHRLRSGGARRHPLSRAVNIRQSPLPLVCDTTAGLGRDAFTLAAAGCRLVLFERSPIVHALLQDGLNRAAADPEIAEIAGRLRLYHGDARTLLTDSSISPVADVVYLDPMYPATKKSAAVKKGMRALQTLLAADKTEPAQSAEPLLTLAIASARQRVVVKRPASAASLAGATPSGNITSGKTRYDIYAGQYPSQHLAE